MDWGNDNYFIAAKTFDDVKGSARCPNCKTIWAIDYGANEISLHAIEEKCPECDGAVFQNVGSPLRPFETECDGCGKRRKLKLVVE